MLFCKIVSYFLIVNMLVFSDYVETKGYEYLVPKANGNVEIDDVTTCVASDTDDLVNQVDQTCCRDDLILQVNATTNTIGFISTTEVSASPEVM